MTMDYAEKMLFLILLLMECESLALWWRLIVTLDIISITQRTCMLHVLITGYHDGLR